jgi:hypothetical protein
MFHGECTKRVHTWKKNALMRQKSREPFSKRKIEFTIYEMIRNSPIFSCNFNLQACKEFLNAQAALTGHV